MKRFFTLVLLLTSSLLYAQTKLVNNNAASNSPTSGPANIIVSDDDTKMTYMGNGDNFFFVDIPSFTKTSVDASIFTEIERAGNVIFGRGKVEENDIDELIFATTDTVQQLDYFTTGTNFPRIWSTTNGAYFGSGKFEPDNAGRDFIRISSDLTTVTRPFNNVTGGGVDLINKNLYQVQMVPFAGDKILVKAKRTSGDEEYYVWDDNAQTSTQITDVTNSTDHTSAALWPLGKEYGDKVIFFYYDKLYTSDGTAGGTLEIADAAGMNVHGIGGGDDFAIFGNAPDGDLEPYIYTDGGSPIKVDLNLSGSSDPSDFVRNGEYVFFVANTGDGFEPHISDGTVAGTKLLTNINATEGSMVPGTNYDRTIAYAAGNGFVFGATDGTTANLYFTDGENIITLNNGTDQHLGLFTAVANTMITTDKYLYFVDQDKDVFRVTIPDNIYTGTEWTNGAPVAGQNLYINSDVTISADLTVNSIHLPDGVTLTVNNNATLTIDGSFYNQGTLTEDGGNLITEEVITLINLSPVITKIETFLENAETGFEVGKYPESMVAQLTDSLTKATDLRAQPTSQMSVDQMAVNLNDYYKDVLWAKVQPVKKYKNNLEIVLGDMKQAQIKNSIATKDEIDFLLIGMRDMQVDGIRINIFGEAPGDTETLNPNKEIFDYVYTEAKAHGFKIMANPAEFGGGRRIANNNLDDLGDEVNGVQVKSNRLRDRVLEFAAEYQVDYISAFNEDCMTENGGCFNSSQITAIYSAMQNNVNGAAIVGGDNNNLPAAIAGYQNTSIRDYISIATAHNLGFDHDLWDDFIALADAKGLPSWDSEATDNPKVVNNVEKESRMVVAIEAGVEGLVFYNNWSSINLETGAIGDGGIAGMEKYLEDNTDLITAITINGSAQVDIGSNISLTTTTLPTSPRDSRIHWSSSDESKATVDQSGVVTGIDHGLVTITASAIDGSGITATYEVQSGDIFVSAINISGDSEMLLGSMQTLTAEVLPVNASDQTYTWSSSNTSIATVSTTGEINALALGTVTITATANDADAVSQTFEITINPVLVATMVISGSSTMTVLGTQTLLVTILPENATDKTFVWSSSNEEILSITENGEVTANDIGTAIITATATDEGQVTAELSIEVTPILVSGIVIDGEPEMKITETQTLSTLVFPTNATDKSVTWSSDNTEIATINSEGVVTPVALGDVVITATANDESQNTDDFSISINPELITELNITGATEMLIDETQTLSVGVLPVNASDQTYSWSSSNTSIASVSAAGEINALSVGTVTITATANDVGGVSETFEIIVNPVLVSSIVVSGSSSMTILTTQTLMIAILPENATDKTYQWSSSDENVLSVSSNGLVTANSIGSAIITASASDTGAATGELSIEVSPILVTSVVISGETEMTITETQTLTTLVSPATATDNSISWASSNSAIATINSEGLVTPLALGNVTFTATANDGSGSTNSFDVSVNPELVTGIEITGRSALAPGDTETFSATFTPEQATNKDVVWSSNDQSIATIEQTGTMTALAAGTVTITATASDGSGTTGSIEVTVSVNIVQVNNLSISGLATMTDQDTQTLTVAVLPSDATTKIVSWSSSNNEIATVNQEGVVSAIAVGNVTITTTATDDSGVSDSFEITINPLLVTGVSVTGISTMLDKATQMLTATVTPVNATDASVTWSSSDENIATVSTAGLVTALNTGEVIITATAEDASSASGTFSIDILPINVASIVVDGDQTMTVEGSQTLATNVLPGNATDPSVTWSSSDSNLATVTAEGVVSALGVGTVTITATANDASGISGSIEITINPILLSSIEISGNSIMTIESTQTLNLITAPTNATNANVDWSSSNPSIATVSNLGVVTAVSLGNVTISATAQDESGRSESIMITIEAQLISSISISGNGDMKIGDTQNLIVTISPENATNTDIAWTSSNNEVVIVSETGEVTALSVGTATITATTNDGSNLSETLVIEVTPKLVTEISVSGESSMIIGSIQTLTASILPENATDLSIIWSSSNNNLASVNQGGLVSALGTGVVTITATATDGSGTSGSFDILIDPILVSSIELLGNTTMTDQATQTLSVTTLPQDATNADVSWSSSNESVATVSSTGVVTAQSVGNTSITATAQDASGLSQSITITVEPLLVASISIEGNGSMFIGSLQTLAATASPNNATNANVTWSSSNSEILTVSTTGEVMAIAVGTADISAVAIDGSGITETLTIIVNPIMVSEITITGTSEMTIGSSQTLAANILPESATDATVTWSSDDTGIATVTTEGLVKTISVGTVSITATATDGSNISSSITIDVLPLLVSELTIAGESTMTDGSMQTLTATVTPTGATDASITWTTSDEAIATVSSTGEVAALSVGAVSITATANDASGVSTSFDITVDPILVATISITGNVEITEGETLQLSATVAPDNANDASVTWSVDDSSIATITETGLLTSLLPGTITVTAMANDASGVSGTVDVVINKKIIAGADHQISVDIFPNPASEVLSISLPTDSHNASYRLVNLSGKVLIDNIELSRTQTINVANLQRGVYLLIINADGLEVTQRVILE